MHETLVAHLPKDEARRPEEVFRAAREVVTFRSQRYSYERRVQYEHEKSRKPADARLQYGKAHTLDAGFLPNALYYDDAIEEWSSSSSSSAGESDDGENGGAARLRGRTRSAAAQHGSRSTGSGATASAGLSGGALANPTTSLELDDSGSAASTAAAAGAAAAVKGGATDASSSSLSGAAPTYAPYNTASWPARFVVLPAEGEAVPGAANPQIQQHQHQQPSVSAVTAAVAAAAALADPDRGGAAGATQRAHMVLGRSSSNRRTSGAQTWLLRSVDHSGSVEAAAASLAAAAASAAGGNAADGGGGGAQRRPSSGYHGGGRADSGPIPQGAGAPPPASFGLTDPLVGRGGSFTSGYAPVPDVSAAAGASSSALSFTSGAASSSSRALKPTPLAPLRATASFTLGSTASGNGSSHRPVSAARARARAGAGADAVAVASGGVGLHAQHAPPLLPQAGEEAEKQPSQPPSQKLAPLTRALSLNLNRLASSIGLNYMNLGRRGSHTQGDVTAGPAAAGVHRHAVCDDDADSGGEDEAADQLCMLRGGHGGSSSAAGEQVERSWRSFTMGLRRHTTTADGGCSSGGGDGAGGGPLLPTATRGGSFTGAAGNSGSGAVIGLGGASMRVRFVPGDEDEDEGDVGDAAALGGRLQPAAAAGRGRLGGAGLPPRSGRARRSTHSNTVVPHPYESIAALQGGAAPPPLLTQPPPQLVYRTAGNSLSGGGAAGYVYTATGAADIAVSTPPNAGPAPAAPPLPQRAQSFTAARRSSSVLLTAAASELAHALGPHAAPTHGGAAPPAIDVRAGEGASGSGAAAGPAAFVDQAERSEPSAAAAPAVVRIGLFGQRELPPRFMLASSTKPIEAATAAATVAAPTPPPPPTQKANWREVPVPVGAPPRSDRMSRDDVFRIMRTTAKQP
ncbi:hypothetical protein HYH02_013169 [Chlamydomonas schloesseri]|uniref:Uncharacterized protein n=1 Tax=Chlamydomonas schloesseri TaxID=2026947 RepID=A0A835W0T8_9CHLO|nr:hypothetical protein HYH02_013169 [Chlamydomonas schloesseri]|eukprot:KAG2431951.1 hypothetical protein HYH02_013169 [Chlamydomonas schloesseri]